MPEDGARGRRLSAPGVALDDPERRAALRLGFVHRPVGPPDELVGGSQFVDSVTVDSTVLEPVANTGGHIDAEHIGEKPTGRWEPDSATITDGTLEQTFFADSVAGDDRSTMFWEVNEEGSACSGVQFESVDRIAVRIPHLVPIPEGPTLFVDTIISGHLAVNFAQNSVRRRTLLTAAFYDTLFSEKMRLNAASLPFGGVYEVFPNWTWKDSDPARRGHEFHRIGTDVDLDSPDKSASVERLKWLRLFGEAAGFRKCIVEDGNHVHCFGNSRSYNLFK